MKASTTDGTTTIYSQNLDFIADESATIYNRVLIVDKEDLEFLFDNLAINNSKVLTSLLFDTLVGYVNAPNIYSQEEFDNLRIKTLINLGQTEKALSLINNIKLCNLLRLHFF